MQLTSTRWFLLLPAALGVMVLVLAWSVLAKLNRDTTLTVASGQSGGTYLPIAQRVAELVDSDSTSLHLDVEESDGSVDNMRRLLEGEAQVALVQNDTLGEEGVRALVPLHTGALHFLVRKGSQIESLADLPAYKIGIGLQTSGTHRMVSALFDHFDLDLETLDHVELSIAEGCDRLREGKIDALLMVLSLRSEALVELVSSGEIDLVGIGRDMEEGSVVRGFRLAYPFGEPVMIPRFAYAPPQGDRPGVPAEPIPTIGVRTVLVAHESVSEEAARELTRVVMEKRSLLTREFEGVNMTDGEPEAHGLQFPLHRGAVAYYNRNEPGFFVEYAEVIGLLMTVVVGAWGLLATMGRWLDQRKKDRIDEYYLEINEVFAQLEQVNSADEFDSLEERLSSLRTAAMQQLTAEKLDANESFRIFQSLLAEALEEVRYRRKSDASD